MSLLSLPNELLTSIAQTFIPQVQDTMTNRAYYPNPYCGIIQDRLTLLALTKTNRRLNAIATPCLYHTIFILDRLALYQLVWSLTLSKDLARLVRVLHVVSIFEGSLGDIADKLDEALVKVICEDGDMQLGRYLARCMEGRNELFLECTFPLLLCLVSHLQCLYLHIPGEEDGIFNRIRSLWRVEDWQIIMDKMDRLYGDHPENFLPHLSLLSMTPERSAKEAVLYPEFVQRFMGGSGNIRQVELFYPHLWSEDAAALSPDKWRNLESIRVVNASTSGVWWYELFKQAAPKLKKLDISLGPEYPTQPGKQDEDQRGFNEALSLCAESLEYLRLEIETPHQPAPAKHLPCISSMTKLKHLEVSMTALFPISDAMEAAGDMDICDFLPPSLQTLCLNEEIWHPWRCPIMGTNIQHERLLHGAILQLMYYGNEKLPRLKRVRVLAGEGIIIKNMNMNMIMTKRDPWGNHDMDIEVAASSCLTLTDFREEDSYQIDFSPLRGRDLRDRDMASEMLSKLSILYP